MRPSFAMACATIVGLIAAHLLQIALLAFALVLVIVAPDFKGGGAATHTTPEQTQQMLTAFAGYMALKAAPFILALWTLQDWRGRFASSPKQAYYAGGGAVGVPVLALLFSLAAAAFGHGPASNVLLPAHVTLFMNVQSMVMPGFAAGLVMSLLVRERLPAQPDQTAQSA